jgi:hypothetical protein
MRVTSQTVAFQRDIRIRGLRSTINGVKNQFLINSRNLSKLTFFFVTATFKIVYMTPFSGKCCPGRPWSVWRSFTAQGVPTTVPTIHQCTSMIYTSPSQFSWHYTSAPHQKQG